jgi:hypothetical protein
MRRDVVSRVCPVCGDVFLTFHRDQQTCSRTCGRKALWARPEFRAKMQPKQSRPHRRETIEKLRRHHFNGEMRVVRSNGYVYIYAPDHPRASNARVPEQVLIAERVLGRPLRRDETVHHVNQVKTDNRNENLLICTVKYHVWLHRQLWKRTRTA